jgi:FkbM family methyltransferase
MKNIIKKIARVFGGELRRYAPDRSDDARMERILAHFGIDIVLDVGANIGQYASHLRDLGYRGKIVSFEPLSSVYAHLLRVSSHDPLWEIAPQAAIGDSEGNIRINISRNIASSSALPMLGAHLASALESEYVASETVTLRRLDTIAAPYLTAAHKAIYLKIDVQGLEARVLEGASGILPRVTGIQLELSLAPLYEGETPYREMLERLDSLGYYLFAVVPGFSNLTSGRLLQMDGIFFRKE